MQLIKGQIKEYETRYGKAEALQFRSKDKEYWIQRDLHHGRYQIGGLLGIGGVGCVFIANDRWNFNNKVVIKTPCYMGDYCFPYASRSQAVFEKQLKSLNRLYQREKKHLTMLSNAGFDSIPNLNGYFLERSLDLCKPFQDAAGVQYYISENLREQAPYLVMKYIRGEMLQDVVAKKPLSQIKTLAIAKQVLTMMKYLHKPQKAKSGRLFYYLMCDLKAENVIITDNDQVSLIDFGALKRHWLDQGEIDLPIFVTDGYAAPEVYSGGIEFRDNPRIDKTFDIFTVGALMCHCLTAIHPYNFLVGTNPPEHDFNFKKNPHISTFLQEIIYRATAKRRRDRYQDAETMLNDVRRAFRTIERNSSSW